MDTNADGQVSFEEYSNATSIAGLKSTTSAQQFIRISEGQHHFNADQHAEAMATNSALRPVYKTQYQGAFFEKAKADSIVKGVKVDYEGYTPVEPPPQSAPFRYTQDIVREKEFTSGHLLGVTSSNLTNSATQTTLDTSNNPQMQVWGNDINN